MFFLLTKWTLKDIYAMWNGMKLTSLLILILKQMNMWQKGNLLFRMVRIMLIMLIYYSRLGLPDYGKKSGLKNTQIKFRNMYSLNWTVDFQQQPIIQFIFQKQAF